MVDKHGAKAVLIGGFLCVALGSLFVVYVTAEHPGMLTVIIGLIIMGLGIGFTMGTPLNYIMLANTDPKEANSSLATMSLVRSIGTAVAPAIMVGFISHAGLAVQDNIMDLLPKEMTISNLPHYEEIVEEVNTLKESDEMEDVDIPEFDGMTKVNISDMSDGDYEIPEETLELLQNSDVTTITANVITMSTTMFKEMTPDIIEEISDGIEANKGIEGQQEAVQGMSQSAKVLDQLINKGTVPKGKSLYDVMPDNVKNKLPADAKKKMKSAHSISDLKKMKKDMESARSKMASQKSEMESERAEMSDAMTEMKNTAIDMVKLSRNMKALEDGLPAAFEEANKNYNAEIQKRHEVIETTFQKTLNDGFKNIYRVTLIASILGILMLLLYSRKRENPEFHG